MKIIILLISVLSALISCKLNIRAKNSTVHLTPKKPKVKNAAPPAVTQRQSNGTNNTNSTNNNNNTNTNNSTNNSTNDTSTKSILN